jgi:hypothetical protein
LNDRPGPFPLSFFPILTMQTKLLAVVLLLVLHFWSFTSIGQLCEPSGKQSVFLRSRMGWGGGYRWQMRRADQAGEGGWMEAMVPGTVLNSLVRDKVYPDPYFGDNNKLNRRLIPDIADAGREFYHYWLRTAFAVPASFTGKRVWLKFNGINYRCVIWLNGHSLARMAGMFNDTAIDITEWANRRSENLLAVDVLPVDFPGSNKPTRAKAPGAMREAKNGGDGIMGRNVTMLMSAGWDFTFKDGIRDRNTGIWRDVELYATGAVLLQHPYVQTRLGSGAAPVAADTGLARETVSVELRNATAVVQRGVVKGLIDGVAGGFEQSVVLQPGEVRQVVFDAGSYPSLRVRHPILWWPVNKGGQHLYRLRLQYMGEGGEREELGTRFGIREIGSDRNTPDSSRRFLVNGAPVFIRGANWIPEAMCNATEQRVYAELRYTHQAGINFLRLWGGGIAESDRFYRLCDEFGIMVWSEFWITGNTRMPVDTPLYMMNVASTVKRIRGHASIAYYVSANESSDLPGAEANIHQYDSVTGYQATSECCGIHDGSPYKYVNPMQYFENTASGRGSRVDGFNPEYGTPCLPTVECLREMMPAKDLWPINDSVWDYLDGGGFHLMTTVYRQAVEQFGPSGSIDEYAAKAQFVGAMGNRALWEAWNYNKFQFGDRWCSGLLFWYLNSPARQTAGRMWDWSLEPTAALYYTQNALQPLHPQFDYLKNTVSVYNDYRMKFTGYMVRVTLYDLDSRVRMVQKKRVDIPADGVANDVFGIVFPADLTPVHFIRLELMDAAGKPVSESLYWRSKDKYEKAGTITGPAMAGFAEINKLPATKLTVDVRKEYREGRTSLLVHVGNPGPRLAFFTRLQLQYADGSPVRPAFYSDNFFCLAPGEGKEIRIEVESGLVKGRRVELLAGAWNAKRSVVMAETFPKQ